IGWGFGKLLDLPSGDPVGRWPLHVRVSSRGLVVGPGLEYSLVDPQTHRELFQFQAEFDLIPDWQDDKGLVRGDRDDRSVLRTWFHARGRWSPTATEWWDLALSRQSDPGVQSEFFEHDFLEYEQKDNYLHWRKAMDELYLYGSLKVLLEDRTDV